MQRNQIIATALGCSMALAGATAQAAEPNYFISPMVGYAFSDFDDTQTGPAAQLGFGANLTPRFGVEVKGFYNELDIKNVQGQYRQKGASVDAFYKFVKRARWEMYGVTGIGFARQDVPPGAIDDDDSVDPTFDLGTGFLFPMNSISTALRADFRYRNQYHGDADTYGRSSFYQLFANVGLVFPYRNDAAPTPVSAPFQPLPSDGDNDGVINSLDECPNTPRGMSVLPNGCSVDQDVVLEGVNFEFNSARLTPNSKLVLNDVARTIRDTPDIKLEVAGHTDGRGNAKYNQRLSEERARAVVDYLVSKGVKRSRLKAIGYGEAKPAASNATDAGRAENRRVELNPEDSVAANLQLDQVEEEAPEEASDVTAQAQPQAAKVFAAAPEATTADLGLLGFAGKKHLTSSAKLKLNAAAKALLAGQQAAEFNVEGEATDVQTAAIRQHLISRGVRTNRLKTTRNGSEIRLDYAF